ncbi:MAG: helix-turn-helix transcriptional regulator [Candidatus Woodwardiibium sp.]|jgi:hypothetical protein
MNLGDSLFHARRKQGLSQEAVAEQLGVSRQTVSKWEANETLPDIRQSKLMAKLYHTSLDELIEFDPDVQELQEWIDQTPDSVTDKIDWTQTWAKKYPILVRYQSRVNIPHYAARLNAMLEELRREYGFDEQDAMLVLKDILAQVWKSRKKQK